MNELANFFVGEPLRAYAVAGIFCMMFGFSFLVSHRFRAGLHLPPAVACVAWFLFGLNEFFAKENGWNIRIDLLILWPGIMTLSATCTIIWLVGLARIARNRLKY